MVRLPCCHLLLLFWLSGVQGACPAPENPPYATLIGGELNDSYPVGTILRYKCIPGYQVIVGSNPSIECLENSTWSQTPTFCELKRCKVPVLENGKIETSGNLEFGDEVTFVCDEGYRLIGTKTARCTLIGNKVEWDKSPPLCERIPCERPPRITNGSHSGDESTDHYTVGTVITYTCDKDFSLIGDPSIICIVAEDGINGKWDRPPPKCQVVQCSRPQIQNGKVTSGFQPSYQYEHVLQFVCDAGYTMVGSEFVKCGANNTWYPELPTCVKDILTTRPTSTPTPTVHPEGDKKNETSAPASTPTPTVHPGGDKKNETSGACPAPENPPYATLIGGELNDSYPVGTILRYKCIPGYQVIVGSNPSIECLENSTWSQTPTFCELKRCKVPVLENGKIETSGNLEFGDEVTFVCDEGYRLIGTKTARCTLIDNKVEWDKSPPLCERIPCERPPRITNGSHSGDESTDHYTVGTVITYTCDKDFSLIGDPSIICIVAEDGINGKWDRPPPKCQVVKCSRPQIQNGKLTSGFQPSYQYEHVLQFVCDAGYTMVGSEFVKCGANNTWYPELPTCVKGATILPTTKTTKGIINTGPTWNPSGTVTKDGSGNNNSVAFVAGKLSFILILLILAV